MAPVTLAIVLDTLFRILFITDDWYSEFKIKINLKQKAPQTYRERVHIVFVKVVDRDTKNSKFVFQKSWLIFFL